MLTTKLTFVSSTIVEVFSIDGSVDKLADVVVDVVVDIELVVLVVVDVVELVYRKSKGNKR